MLSTKQNHIRYIINKGNISREDGDITDMLLEILPGKMYLECTEIIDLGREKSFGLRLVNNPDEDTILYISISVASAIIGDPDAFAIMWVTYDPKDMVYDKAAKLIGLVKLRHIIDVTAREESVTYKVKRN